MISGITLIDNFIGEPDALFQLLITTVRWDERMAARKTASFGKAYNYSQMEYPFQEFLPELAEINDKIRHSLGFKPNNCLLNYYLDGKSKMGYHSDQIDILADGTGIAIVSLGETRTLSFKNKLDQNQLVEYTLNTGSLVYMTQQIQRDWQHAIPGAETHKGRISLTFRMIK